MKKMQRMLVAFALIVAGAFAFLGGPAMAQEDQVSICHFPPGNPDNVQFITVGESALDAHLEHGDFEADSASDCDRDDDDDDDDDDKDKDKDKDNDGKLAKTGA